MVLWIGREAFEAGTRGPVELCSSNYMLYLCNDAFIRLCIDIVAEFELVHKMVAFGTYNQAFTSNVPTLLPDAIPGCAFPQRYDHDN